MEIKLSNNWKTTAATVSAAAISGVVASYVWKEYISRKPIPTPKKWIRVGTVKDLIIYPIKSCKGVSVPEVTATNIGLKGKSSIFCEKCPQNVNF